MSRVIRVENIRYGSSRSEYTELMGVIRLEQIRVKASGERRGSSERSKNIMERDKSRAKREKKSVVRISEQRSRTLVWSRAEQSVQYRTT